MYEKRHATSDSISASRPRRRSSITVYLAIFERYLYPSCWNCQTYRSAFRSHPGPENWILYRPWITPRRLDNKCNMSADTNRKSPETRKTFHTHSRTYTTYMNNFTYDYPLWFTGVCWVKVCVRFVIWNATFFLFNFATSSPGTIRC